jgi:hypothetical protein
MPVIVTCAASPLTTTDEPLLTMLTLSSPLVCSRQLVRAVLRSAM